MMKIVKSHDVVLTADRYVWITEWEVDGKPQLVINACDLGGDPAEISDSWLSPAEARKVARTLLAIAKA
ncbi:MAG TPA: hypothetical protein VFF65_02850 [Phycisphaerales bacterium]|nr:hypothetical protein [Phycisphaerales bacterium]